MKARALVAALALAACGEKDVSCKKTADHAVALYLAVNPSHPVAIRGATDSDFHRAARENCEYLTTNAQRRCVLRATTHDEVNACFPTPSGAALNPFFGAVVPFQRE